VIVLIKKEKHNDIDDILNSGQRSNELRNELSSEEYDVFVNEQQFLSQGFYKERNEALLTMIKPYMPRNVFEFACAGPFLAKLLLSNLGCIEKYTCSNISVPMVQYCTNYLANESRCRVGFIDAEVKRSTAMHRQNIKEYDTFITTSLEHIQFDCEMIKELPIGAKFIFSVPSFDDPGHFRYFININEVLKRYNKLLDILGFWTSLDRNKMIVMSVRKDQKDKISGLRKVYLNSKRNLKKKLQIIRNEIQP
jgi:hypothetical protein